MSSEYKACLFHGDTALVNPPYPTRRLVKEGHNGIILTIANLYFEHSDQHKTH